MSRTVQARLDERAEDDLALLRGEVANDSEAMRLALQLRHALKRAGRQIHQVTAREPSARVPVNDLAQRSVNGVSRPGVRLYTISGAGAHLSLARRTRRYDGRIAHAGSSVNASQWRGRSMPKWR
jgi:hypothetical protein